MSGKHARPDQLGASVWQPVEEALQAHDLGLQLVRGYNANYEAIKKEQVATIAREAIAAAEAEAYLHDAVREATMLGVGWPEIGAAIGLSGHVAYHRFDANAKNHHARPDNI